MAEIGKELDYHGRITRQKKVRIIEIDSREPHDRLTDILLGGLGYTVSRRILPLGDYQWDSKLGRVIVERKTPIDAADIPRLSRQLGLLRRASRDGCFVILLIDHRKSHREPWSDIEFDNLLLSAQGRVRVVHCLQGQLAHRLDSLYRWTNKSNHQLMEE